MMNIPDRGKSTDALAQVLWNYHVLHQPVESADVILVFGSHDVRVAEYAAKLYLDDYAPLLIFSGGVGRLTHGWRHPEAEVFAGIAREAGVPRDAMLLEAHATNTGENVTRAAALLKERSIEPTHLILVHKPYMERRAFATFQKQYPGEVHAIVTSPPISFIEYPNEDMSKDEVINILVGDTQRIPLYVEKGFIVPQDMPREVVEAMEELIRRGYNEHTI